MIRILKANIISEQKCRIYFEADNYTERIWNQLPHSFKKYIFNDIDYNDYKVIYKHLEELHTNRQERYNLTRDDAAIKISNIIRSMKLKKIKKRF